MPSAILLNTAREIIIDAQYPARTQVASVTELATTGVEFTRYGFMKQDKQGIWDAPGGTRVAWFKDPDGNTLSLSQHPK